MLELVRPRSIGVEHAGLEALKLLNLPKILEDAGFNKAQQDVVVASIIARMAEPGSESATWQWLNEQSSMGELLGLDSESMSAMRLHRVSDLLVRHRQKIENTLFSKISELFSLTTTVTLYDLTNTFFEGTMADNDQAQRGHSKEKRSDCPLVTLGLVLDGSGFVRGSQMFAGNISEAKTLQTMLEKLNAPKGALVIMDRGIATRANIDWLIEHNYRYLVVNHERDRSKEKNRGIGQNYQINLSLDAAGTTVTGISWEQKPVDGTQLSHPGVYCLRTNELEWDEATLWRTYTMLTDLESVFRSLKSELGLRPVYHHKEERADGHLFITVLAYQAVQVIRRKLKSNGINDNWNSLRKIFSSQRRVTATFRQKDDRTLHVRKTTMAESKLKKLYDALEIAASPVGTQKTIY